MTLESFRKAEAIVKEIEDIDREIGKVNTLLDNVNVGWDMRVYSDSVPANSYYVEHHGLLPKFLEEIADVLHAKRDKLLAKLAML